MGAKSRGSDGSATLHAMRALMRVGSQFRIAPALLLPFQAGIRASLLALFCNAAVASPNFLAHLEGMQFTDQHSQIVRLDDLRGQIVVINFIFTACSSACPVQTNVIAGVLREWPQSQNRFFRMLSISLDPLSDTPATLKAYAKRFNAQRENWSFVTGRPQDVDRLATALWLFPGGKAKAPLDTHDSSLWLIDANGAVRLRLAGNPPEPKRLVRELTQLMSERQSLPLSR